VDYEAGGVREESCWQCAGCVFDSRQPPIQGRWSSTPMTWNCMKMLASSWVLTFLGPVMDPSPNDGTFSTALKYDAYIPFW